MTKENYKYLLEDKVMSLDISDEEKAEILIFISNMDEANKRVINVLREVVINRKFID